MQKGFSAIFILIGVLVLTVVVGAYWIGTKNDQSAKQTTVKQSSDIPTSQGKVDQYNLSETNNFPVYPQAIFAKKEKQPICEGEVSGFSVCNTATYTWQTKDDFDQVSSFYREDKSNSGWKCSGGAGSYGGSRSSTTKTTCRKGDLAYDLSFSADATKTEIVLQIP